MRRVACLFFFLLLGLAGSAHAFDRQGMATMGGYLGWSHLGGAPSLSSEPRSRLSFRGLTKYQLNNHVRLVGSAAYAWASYKGTFDQGSHETLDTLLVISPYELGLEYSFGPDFKASRPYAGVQMGVYRWRFVSNAPFIRHTVRDTVTSKDLARTYFGLGFTLGEEYFWKDGASATLQFGYHHIKSNNTTYFNNPDFTRFISSVNLMEIQAGLNYYFDLPGRKRIRTAAATAARPDSVKIQGSARPNVEKESIQIDPNAVKQDAGGAVPRPTPSARPPVTPAPIVPPPAPPADTAKPMADTATVVTPPAAVPDSLNAKEMPDSVKAMAPPPAAQPDSSLTPPPARPDSDGATASPPAAPPASPAPGAAAAPLTTPPAPAEPSGMAPAAPPDSSGVKQQ